MRGKACWSASLFFMAFFTTRTIHNACYIIVSEIITSLCSLADTEEKFSRGKNHNLAATRKICLRVIANNKGEDQRAHPLSLISAFVQFVFRWLRSIISRLDTNEISIFSLASLCSSWAGWFEVRKRTKIRNRYPSTSPNPGHQCDIHRGNPEDRFARIVVHMIHVAREPIFGGRDHVTTGKLEF